MPILSQTLKGHNSETVCPFELKFFVEIYFGQLYQESTREVLEIHQSIAIGALSMPVLGGLWPLFPGGLKEVRGPYFMAGSRESVAYITWGFKGEHSLYFMGDSRGSVTHIEDSRGSLAHISWGGPYSMECQTGSVDCSHGGSRGSVAHISWGFKLIRGPYVKEGLGVCGLYFMRGSSESMARISRGYVTRFSWGFKGVHGLNFKGV
jgi:hypothetical protein